MIAFLKKILDSDPTDYYTLVKDGAMILDVRSEEEYDRGNIIGSINIPLDELMDNLHELKFKNVPIITCCASGRRSARAQKILKMLGYNEVFDGGGWQDLEIKIK